MSWQKMGLDEFSVKKCNVVATWARSPNRSSQAFPGNTILVFLCSELPEYMLWRIHEPLNSIAYLPIWSVRTSLICVVRLGSWISRLWIVCVCVCVCVYLRNRNPVPPTSPNVIGLAKKFIQFSLWTILSELFGQPNILFGIPKY